jgi:crotonobetainyl-CoA:carnitine CoA-transferase CaiB-like acyl-CoA transferase
MNPDPLPLEGLRVLDFTHAAAGPFATMFIADLGADVIKIEKPGRGDGARYMGEPLQGPGQSDYYLSLNRNKRSLLIDLGMDEGVDLARKVAARCDVVVQNFRPGVMERLGLGFEELAPLRRGLVYCSISAFGPTGPWRDRPANDVIMQSISGIMDMTGEADGGPVRVGAPVCDFSTGLFALIGILSALAVRATHPEGQHVQTSMLDSSIAMMANYMPAVMDLGRQIPRLGLGHAQIVPYQAFRCRDGAYVMVGAFTQGFWRRLCGLLGREEWIDDPRFESNAERLEHRDELLELMEPLFLDRTREEWLALLGEADVPSSPLNGLHETVRTPQVVENRIVREIQTSDGGAIHVVGLPVRCEQWPDELYRPPPRMGEDTESILSELLELPADEISRMVEAHIVRGTE